MQASGFGFSRVRRSLAELGAGGGVGRRLTWTRSMIYRVVPDPGQVRGMPAWVGWCVVDGFDALAASLVAPADTPPAWLVDHLQMRGVLGAWRAALARPVAVGQH